MAKDPVDTFMNEVLEQLLHEGKEEVAVLEFFNFKSAHANANYSKYPSYHRVCNLVKQQEEASIHSRTSSTASTTSVSKITVTQKTSQKPPQKQVQKHTIEVDSSSFSESDSEDSQLINTPAPQSVKKRRNIRNMLSLNELTPGSLSHIFITYKKPNWHVSKNIKGRNNSKEICKEHN